MPFFKKEQPKVNPGLQAIKSEVNNSLVEVGADDIVEDLNQGKLAEPSYPIFPSDDDGEAIQIDEPSEDARTDSMIESAEEIDLGIPRPAVQPKGEEVNTNGMTEDDARELEEKMNEIARLKANIAAKREAEIANKRRQEIFAKRSAENFKELDTKSLPMEELPTRGTDSKLINPGQPSYVYLTKDEMLREILASNMRIEQALTYMIRVFKFRKIL